MSPRTPANRILRWKSTLRGATILTVDKIIVKSKDHFKLLIKDLSSGGHKNVTIIVSPVEKVNVHVDSTISQVSFDQKSIMAH